jgi:hypothetical protein
MARRKGISPKIRFEVFKRDAFTCQYCGAKAPDVILQVDHISPVAGGGDNDIVNLITACRGCNGGKGATQLSDQSTLAKQRAQLEEINERREQLRLMVSWRAGLQQLEDEQCTVISDLLIKKCGYGLSEIGRAEVKKWLRQYGLEKTLTAVETGIEQYAKPGADGLSSPKDIAVAWQKIPGILRIKSSAKPYLGVLFYIRGILRNRLVYVDERLVMDLTERAHLAGFALDDMKDLARHVRNWQAFRDELEDFIDQAAP